MCFLLLCYLPFIALSLLLFYCVVFFATVLSRFVVFNVFNNPNPVFCFLFFSTGFYYVYCID